MAFPKPNPDSVTRLLSVRLSQEEMLQLRKSAATHNLRVSDYTRLMLKLDQKKVDAILEKAADRKLPDLQTLTSLARANNNLNQIARALNTANKAGSHVTLRLLVAQLEAIQEDLTAIRNGRG